MAVLRSATDADLDAVLAMNNAAVPAVSEVDRAAMEEFLQVAHTFTVVDVDGDVGGFLIGLGPGLTYPSLNYRWFSARYDDFVYVDRIVIAEAARSRGTGWAVYDDFAERGRASGAPVMLAEVNIRPRNDGSLRFHDRYGFVSVGEQDTDGGAKRVTMLEFTLG